MVRRYLSAFALAPVFVLAACSGAQEFNDADVAFATEMIPHHAQAVEMAALVNGKDVDPDVSDLAEDIEGAQEPEIDTMSGWLEDWDQPVPDVDDPASMQSDMAGMMTPQDLADLEAADGEEFQVMWLTMMIEHHEGAIEMARSEQAEGENDDAVDLAETIETAQSSEIDLMKEILARP